MDLEVVRLFLSASFGLSARSRLLGRGEPSAGIVLPDFLEIIDHVGLLLGVFDAKFAVVFAARPEIQVVQVKLVALFRCCHFKLKIYY